MEIERGSPERESTSWIGYELHDGLMQWIVSARLQLISMLESDRAEVHVKKSSLEQLLACLNSAADEGRQLMQFLEQNTASESKNLTALVRDFVTLVDAEATQAGSTIDVQGPGDTMPVLPGRITWNALRIIQQALRNAIAHAGPCHIQVNLKHNLNLVSIEIQDDGRGMESVEASKSLPNHLGLRGMEHRAQVIESRLDITSTHRHGTCVILTIPISGKK